MFVYSMQQVHIKYLLTTLINFYITLCITINFIAFDEIFSCSVKNESFGLKKNRPVKHFFTASSKRCSANNNRCRQDNS